MNPTIRPRPVLLCILDGWGHSDARDANAIATARTPVWDRMMAECPHALLDASAGDVGLPEGQMGNSEVGHMCLGAGRIVLQDLPRIDAALADGSLALDPVLARLEAALGRSGGACHLLGLLSPGGVHSHQDHIAALARILAARDLPVRIHAILDGRDTPPRSALDHLARFESALAGLADVRIATVAGRFYSMDRDRRWERTERAYGAYVLGRARQAASAREAVEAAYAAGESDEFVAPSWIGPPAPMADGDGLLMANFRADRVRQILAALLDPDFDGFARARRVAFAAAVGMCEYGRELNRWLDSLFPPVELRGILGAVVAEAGLRQLRIAETEKYAHVTYFFNGGEERAFEGEERILVASPRVATYDRTPEMSAETVTDNVVEAIDSGRFDLIVMNYANADMVGHTGRFDAAVAAVEAVDRELGRVRAAIARAGGALLVTADHGNAERMCDRASAQPHTAHTSNRVPAILCAALPVSRLRDGRLADVAPTVLSLLGLAQPPEMTGSSLIAGDIASDGARGPRHAALA